MRQTTADRHVLAIALEPFEAAVHHDPLVAQAGGTQVAVAAPALNTRLRHWVSDGIPRAPPPPRAWTRWLARDLARRRGRGVAPPWCTWRSTWRTRGRGAGAARLRVDRAPALP